MPTYKATFKYYLNQGLSIHYKQNCSQTIIKCTKPSTSNFPESQAGLYLDISLRENSKNGQNWASFQNNLKQLFNRIVQAQNYPNSSVKIFIFIIVEGKDIQACIINGLWLLFLKLGINMKKSIYCIEKTQIKKINSNVLQDQNLHSNGQTHPHRFIYNLNDNQNIIEGETNQYEMNNQQSRQNFSKQLQQYQQFVLTTIKTSLMI